MSEQPEQPVDMPSADPSTAPGTMDEPTRLRQHIPNAMTFTRLALALAFPFLPHAWRLGVLVVAALTEWLDGFLSRRWNAESQLGRMADPVADKLFVLVMLGTFIWEGWLDPLVAVLVLLRDITVAQACILILLFGDRRELTRMRPRPLGKITTALQFTFLLILLIMQQAPIWLVAATVAFSGAAAVDYVVFYYREVRE
ncbi:MAG: CDP-alcohol phosphatidyltransferase family protein [Persicimonas sp.]